jgi:hypothetical protein
VHRFQPHKTQNRAVMWVSMAEPRDTIMCDGDDGNPPPSSSTISQPRTAVKRRREDDDKAKEEAAAWIATATWDGPTRVFGLMTDNLDPAVAEQVMETLAQSNVVTTVDVSHAQWLGENLRFLTGFLRRATCVEAFQMLGGPRPDDTEVAECIAAISDNPRTALRRICVGPGLTGATDNTSRAIARLIANNKTLTHIYFRGRLDWNRYGKRITEAMQHNTTLRVFTESRANFITPAFAVLLERNRAKAELLDATRPFAQLLTSGRLFSGAPPADDPKADCAYNRASQHPLYDRERVHQLTSMFLETHFDD